MRTTEAWVLHRATDAELAARETARLQREPFSFDEPREGEVIAEPVFGCWEANMTHALERLPIDVCRQRGEERVVLGNAGVVRVVETGERVEGVRPGDICCLAPAGVTDVFGYPRTILGYDAARTIGMLARQVKLHERQVIPIPPNTRYSLPQWAAFSLRYVTAWANWRKAYGCWAAQFDDDERPIAHVWGWGGGVTLAEVDLARRSGCQTAMMASTDRRLAQIAGRGIMPVDRREFADLAYNPHRFDTEPEYRRRYQRAEDRFVGAVARRTGGKGASIFIDYIGASVFRATMRALGRYGVVTTAGWRTGMDLPVVRAVECINWRTHVHTHGARRRDWYAAADYAEREGWMPDVDGEICAWSDIPQLADDYARGRLDTYFPIYQVNTV